MQSLSRRTLLASLLQTSPNRYILVHEHILCDFAGADKIHLSRYSEDEAFAAALPRLQEIRSLGCVRFLDCTPNYIGRNPRLLARLAKASGIEIWSNTGLYAAADHKFLPDFARTETAAQLAARWIQETRQGVNGTKPRFIKIGVNKAPLHEWDRKIVAAAALTSKATGLTIACHTGDGPAALEEIEVVRENGANPSKLVWVHAQNERDHAIHERFARAGGWVEFDGINAKSADWHLDCLQFMTRQDLLNRTLISQDSGWYRVGEPGGGEFNGYAYLLREFLPRLPSEQRSTLLWQNPRAAFGD